MNHSQLLFMNELRHFSVALAIASSLAVGCTQNVDPVGDGTGGDGATGTSSATNGGNGGEGISGTSSVSTGGTGGTGQGGNGQGGTPTGDHTGIAMLGSELPDIGAGGGSSSVATGPAPDPNILHVMISDLAIACRDPYGLDCGGHWKVSFQLPVELQTPGVYQLEQVDGFFLSSGDEDPVDCSGGGGTWWSGQVEITAIDNQHVVGTFTGTDTFDFDANGSFVATRCFQ
jgi:hypothetical protein